MTGIINLQNYRPISNLPFNSKTIINYVCLPVRLLFSVQDRELLNNEFFDICKNADSGKTAVLVFFDLGAAFHTAGRCISLQWLENWVGLSDPELDWFKSYMKEGNFFVSVGNQRSLKMTCGVLQGSIPGALLLNIDMLSLPRILIKSNIGYHYNT